MPDNRFQMRPIIFGDGSCSLMTVLLNKRDLTRRLLAPSSAVANFSLRKETI